MCIQHSSLRHQTTRRSDMTRMMDPTPATSTTFSCQLSNTPIVCPAPSPTFRAWICENPVTCGERPFLLTGVLLPTEPAMPLYLE